ncbi:MAG: cation transporter [Dehalococcoidia bacterium]|nr:cation transporter [Dehalococcoidia bacterium]
MAEDHRAGVTKALGIGLALTLAFAAFEVAAGVWSGSLALVSDAGHMLVDSAGLLLALAAAAVARKPADLRRSFGYARAEVLVVPVHVVLMLGIAGYIVWEAFARAGEDLEISAGPVLLVGIAGLGVNAFVFRLLHGHSKHNLNARGAMFEVAADALGSVGVIVSALVILATGWMTVDIVVSLVIAALVLPRAWLLLRQAILILLEGAPAEVELAEIERDARAIPGVLGLHDLHIWSLAPSFVSLSAHVEVESMTESERAIGLLSVMLRERHGISHVTLQPETQELHEAVQCCDYPDMAALDHLHQPRIETPAGR